ncbi:MAG: reverse transcriptase domain-containing protein [Cyanobacteria bacterium P01_A01_bin.15]
MGCTFWDLSEDRLRDAFYQLKTREDFATLLQVSDKHLRYHLYTQPRSKLYLKFEIPKKSGGKRIILSPRASLKSLQRKLNHLFSKVYSPKPSTHGFTNEKNIVTNASQHLRQKYILNIDIRNFFPSINFGRVRGLLMSSPYNCNQEVATVLAQICCHENQLPQGAPTSPILSNMICAKLDSDLQRLAKRNQCIYTRYADDITFSTSRIRFPSRLIWFSHENEELILGRELRNTIEDNGFVINESKVRLQPIYKRQEVTGIIVNEKLNVNRKYIRQVRAVLHAWEKYGIENAEKDFFKKYDKHKYYPPRENTFKEIIKGRIEFIGLVRGKNDNIYLRFLKWLKDLAPELVSQDKIDAANLIGSSQNEFENSYKVNIWTEGKTDIKHLKASLRDLKSRGIKYQSNFVFKEDIDKQGSRELLKACEQLSKEARTTPMIALFDRGERDILKKVHDDSRGFKDWGNGVYSFAIPIPTHRLGETDSVCIELYYQDSELTRQDKDNRRLFLPKEFNTKSGRHHENKELNVKNQIRPDRLIIDNDVYNADDADVALSKNIFSDYVLNYEDNFNDFDFVEFKAIFEIIENISRHHFEAQRQRPF